MHKVDKKAFYFLFLCFNFFLMYRVMLVSMFAVQELVLEAFHLMFIFGYIAYRVTRRVMEKDYHLNHLEILMGVFFFLPFIPAISAFRVWGQPLTYGIATMREFYLLYGGLIVYNLLREQKVTMKMVEHALLTIAWITITFFYGMSLFVDAMPYRETGFAAAHAAKGGQAYFQFQTGFLFFGSIYYSVQAFLRRKYHYLIYALIFFAYIVLYRLDRTTMAVTAFAIGAFLVTSLSVKTQLMNAVKFGLPVMIIAIFALLIKPDIADNYIMMFGEVVDVAGNSETMDPEDNIRLVELDIAYKYIAENPFFGSGKVSRQWVYGGYFYFLGHFFISDIGIIGQVFLYGIFGALILYSQFPFSAYFLSRMKRFNRDPFLVSIKFILVAISLDSLTNGYLTIFAGQAFMMCILVYRFYEMDRMKLHEELTTQSNES